MGSELLEFEAFPGSVRACVDSRIAQLVRMLLKGWSIARPDADTSAIHIKLEKSGRDYTASGPWVGQDYHLSDPVDAACSFVAEVLKVQANESNDTFCVHAAAVVLGGRAVLFPAEFRTGKSTLTAVLAARGEQILTDDAVFISPDTGEAISPGILPRLRLPLPDVLGSRSRKFIDDRMQLAGKRYGYLAPPDNGLLSNGAAVPIAAFVYLRRKPRGSAALVEVPKSEALRTLIWQNFARQIPPGRILTLLSDLTASRQTCELRYSDPEEAADLLQCTSWPKETVKPRKDELVARGESAVVDRPNLRVASNIVEEPLDTGHFIADENTGRIYHLNMSAAAIWRLLSEGEPPEEIASALSEAFPESAPERISADVRALAQNFRENGLLLPA